MQEVYFNNLLHDIMYVSICFEKYELFIYIGIFKNYKILNFVFDAVQACSQHCGVTKIGIAVSPSNSHLHPEILPLADDAEGRSAIVVAPAFGRCRRKYHWRETTIRIDEGRIEGH